MTSPGSHWSPSSIPQIQPPPSDMKLEDGKHQSSAMVREFGAPRHGNDLAEARHPEAAKYERAFTNSCVLCPKLFTRSTDLERHNKDCHGTGTPFFCPVPLCERAIGSGNQKQLPFRRKDKRKDHVRAVHKSFNVRSFDFNAFDASVTRSSGQEVPMWDTTLNSCFEMSPNGIDMPEYQNTSANLPQLLSHLDNETALAGTPCSQPIQTLNHDAQPVMQTNTPLVHNVAAQLRSYGPDFVQNLVTALQAGGPDMTGCAPGTQGQETMRWNADVNFTNFNCPMGPEDPSLQANGGQTLGIESGQQSIGLDIFASSSFVDQGVNADLMATEYSNYVDGNGINFPDILQSDGQVDEDWRLFGVFHG